LHPESATFVIDDAHFKIFQRRSDPHRPPEQGQEPGRVAEEKSATPSVRSGTSETPQSLVSTPGPPGTPYGAGSISQHLFDDQFHLDHKFSVETFWYNIFSSLHFIIVTQ
jgi:hypothetical protein